MNITTRILSISTFILWVIIIFFFATSVYSVMNLKVEAGQVEMVPSGNGISFSLPFSINNEGYYELSDLNLTTRVSDPNGNIIDLTETFIPSIPQESTVNSSHTVSVDITDIMSMDHEALLLEDNEFLIEIFAGLEFAHTVPVDLSLNTTIPWGAPFANFFVGEMSVTQLDETRARLSIPLSFDNHAVLDISGTLTLEIYNDAEEMITSGMNEIVVPSQGSYRSALSLDADYVELLKLTNSGNIHLIFETTLFSVDWWEPYG
jgi:hypothetical protein